MATSDKQTSPKPPPSPSPLCISKFCQVKFYIFGENRYDAIMILYSLPCVCLAFIEIRIDRIFNTYGPRMNIDDGRVVSNFIAQALRGEALTVQKPGTQTRSLCYVSDMVDGLMRLMEGDDTGPINIGNPGEFTMVELTETVKELINPSIEIKMVENTPDDPRQRKPNQKNCIAEFHIKNCKTRKRKRQIKSM